MNVSSTSMSKRGGEMLGDISIDGVRFGLFMSKEEGSITFTVRG